MSPTQEQIQESIENSRQKHLYYKEKQLARALALKEGERYFRDKKLEQRTFSVKIGEYETSFCYEMIEKADVPRETTLSYTYCIKSRKDRRCHVTQERLLGHRMFTRAPERFISIPDKINTVRAENIILWAFVYIAMRPEHDNHGIPERLHRAVCKKPLWKILGSIEKKE